VTILIKMVVFNYRPIIKMNSNK